jgi:hypothetical protein
MASCQKKIISQLASESESFMHTECEHHKHFVDRQIFTDASVRRLAFPNDYADRAIPRGTRLILSAKTWLGREDSNLRMVESKSTALPLGDAPIDPSGKRRDEPSADFLWHRRSIEGVEPFQQPKPRI